MEQQRTIYLEYVIVNTDLAGLTQAEAARRLSAEGQNVVGDTTVNPLHDLVKKFIDPISCLLEGAILLQFLLHDYAQAFIVFSLLVFNALLGYMQSSRAQATLSALKSQLSLNASVKREGIWSTILAAQLVRGDIIKLSLGSIVPADAKLISGEMLIDDSMITGESIPIESTIGLQIYAGALIKRGEATAEVTQTGARTQFGHAAELVRLANVKGAQQKTVEHVVRNLGLFNAVVVTALLTYSLKLYLPPFEIISLLLAAVLASIPVTLPATFTLAAAISARTLAKIGVLPTRLSAIDEAASMQVLCVDKTGTLTQNELQVSKVLAMPGFDDAHVLGLAALASSDGGSDPLDAAVRSAASKNTLADLPTLVHFVAFDPKKKTAEATVQSATEQTEQLVMKGAFATVIALTRPQADAAVHADVLENQGYRVLAVAFGRTGDLKLAGLLAFSDPPRDDAASLIGTLTELGIRTVMITGDAPRTAAIVAKAVGLPGLICPAGALPDQIEPEDFAVYAGVVPEDKFHLVQALQRSGHVVGMCGDGVNDAPALRQAQIGIAVSTATDVAKSAAGIVLTTAGLSGIVAAVEAGRTTFQRILRYTLNSVAKKVMMILFLAGGLVMTGHAVLTPMLVVILMVVGDFMSMAMTTDNVRTSSLPNVWRIRNLTVAAVAIGACFFVFASTALMFGLFRLHLAPDVLQTLAFVTIVFGSQATTYATRDRRHVLALRPSKWLLISSCGDIAISTILAVYGIFMSPLSISIVSGILLFAFVFGFTLNFLKIPMFRHLKIS